MSDGPLEVKPEAKTYETLKISRKGSTGTPTTFESFELLLTSASAKTAKRNPSDKTRCEALRKAKMTYMQHV